MPKSFPAKYRSTCATCRKPIAVGSMITWGAGRQAVHLDCAKVAPVEIPALEHPSPQQLAIFAALAETDDNLLIQAVAGSGKTTTLIEAGRRLPPKSRSVFLAFSREIADTLRNRLPANMQAATFHSVCFAALRRSLPTTPTLEDTKVRDILTAFCNDGSVTDFEAAAYGTHAVKLVGYAKNAGIGPLLPNEPDQWQTLIDHYDVQVEGDPAPLIALAQRLLAASLNDLTTIDFDDMLYLTLVLPSISFDHYDNIFVDESQDTNAVQRAILRNMLDTGGGRLTAVGDANQAIFGFRGADAEAMDLIAEEFHCVRLPLSVSYRCGRAIVELARTLTEAIEAAPDAPEGTVSTLQEFKLSELVPGDAVLCRNNGPIVKLAFRLLRNGTGCKVLGRNFGQGLTAVIRRMRAHSIEHLLVKLEAYRQRETERLSRRHQDEKLQQLNDKLDSILTVIDALDEDERTIDALNAAIESLFTDTEGKGFITLSTAHRAKGLEWDRVFVLEPGLMPSRWAKQPWQQVQERNLQYVAYTRARQTLHFIDLEAIV